AQADDDPGIIFFISEMLLHEQTPFAASCDVESGRIPWCEQYFSPHSSIWTSCGNLPHTSHRRTNCMRSSTTQTIRLSTKISADLRTLLKHAATQRVVEEAEVIQLSLADQKCFIQALLSPPKPTPALKKALALSLQFKSILPGCKHEN